MTRWCSTTGGTDPGRPHMSAAEAVDRAEELKARIARSPYLGHPQRLTVWFNLDDGHGWQQFKTITLHAPEPYRLRRLDAA